MVGFLKFNILIFFVGDALKVFAKYYDWPFYRYPAFVKVLMLLGYVMFFFDKRRKVLSDYIKILIYCVVLILAFIIGQYLLAIKENDVDIFVANLQYLGRYLYVFPTFVFITILSLSKEQLKKVLSFYLILFWINAFLIVIGFMFDVKLFEIYGESRFGYGGLYSRTSQVSYFFILTSFIYLFNWLEKKENRAKFLLVLLFMVSLLVGTKSIYFYDVLVAVYLLWYYKLYNKPFYIVVLILISIVVFATLIYSGAFYFWLTIVNNDGILNAITSYRSNLFSAEFIYYIKEHWGWFNYFFGGADFGHLHRTEMLIPDLYMFFGIFGFIVYYFFYKNHVLNFKKNSSINLFMIFSVLSVGVLAGNLLHNANIPILVILLSEYIKKNEQFIS